MRMPAEELLGLGVIAFLLWWIFAHRNETVVSSPGASTSTQGFPPGSIYNFPPAPDLQTMAPANFVVNPIASRRSQIVASPAPCSCDCNAGGASDQITKDLTDFTASLTSALGNTYNTYLGNLLAAMPSYVQQYLVNPAGDNANKLLAGQSSITKPQAAISDVQFTNTTAYSLAGGYTDLQGQLTSKDNYSLNTYAAGRVVTVG